MAARWTDVGGSERLMLSAPTPCLSAFVEADALLPSRFDRCHRIAPSLGIPDERVPRPPVAFVQFHNSRVWGKRSVRQASASTRTPGHPFPEGGAPTISAWPILGIPISSILIDQGFPIKSDSGAIPFSLLFLEDS